MKGNSQEMAWHFYNEQYIRLVFHLSVLKIARFLSFIRQLVYMTQNTTFMQIIEQKS